MQGTGDRHVCCLRGLSRGRLGDKTFIRPQAVNYHHLNFLKLESLNLPRDGRKIIRLGHQQTWLRVQTNGKEKKPAHLTPENAFVLVNLKHSL